ncbi:MAG TPA: zinc-dependent metalloprotease family protein [Bacteroidia bacterium]
MNKYAAVYCLVLTFVFNGLNAQFIRTNNDFFKYHSKFELINFDYRSFYQEVNSNSNEWVNLELGTYGKFKCQVSPSNLMLKDGESFVFDGKRKIAVSNPLEHQWKGTLYGSSKALRLNVYPNNLSGMIELDSGILYFETFIENGRPRLIVYNSLHNLKQNDIPFCTVGDHEPKVPGIGTKRSLEYEHYTCKILKLGNVTAFKLFKKHNYDTLATFNEVRDVINLTDAIYSKYIGIRIKLAFEVISLDSNALLNTSNNSYTRFGDFKKIIKNISGKIQADVNHLFSEGFIPDPQSGNAIGLAEMAAVCDKGRNYSTSQGHFRDLNFWSGVLAHELGHNLNAEHSNSSLCNANGSIMCPAAVTGPYYFNATEINVIKQFLPTLDSKNDRLTPSCAEYPVSLTISDFELKDVDSVLVPIKLDPDFKVTRYKYGNNKVEDVSNKDQIWIKTIGFNYLIYDLDTVNNLSCRYENKFFVAKRDFVVRNLHVNGPGSLGNAILNSNVVAGMDTIVFALPNTYNVIDIDTLLPPVIDSCVINGASQKGFQKMRANSPYRPSVTLRSKLPSSMTSDKICFSLARRQYEISNLNFEDFYSSIRSHLGDFLYSTDYKYVYTEFKDSNYIAVYRFKGNKFLNNSMAVYVTSFELNNGSDEIVLGGDSIHEGNVFLNTVGVGTRMAYSKNLRIKNNYFGFEPGIDTFKTFEGGIALSFCSNVKIHNNAFGKFTKIGLEAGNSDGEIYNNVFGQNSLTKQVGYFSGVGIRGGIAYTDGPILKIGDTVEMRKNVFYGRKNKGAINFFSARNVHALGNLVLSTDTSSSTFDTTYLPRPYKSLQLDSMIHSCGNVNVQKVFGSITPAHMNDTFFLHFYAVPKGVKYRREPMHRYLGIKQLICTDTLPFKFSHTLSNASINEGVIYTATSVKMQQTGDNSNAVYPKNILSDPIKISSDTCVCPQQTIKLNFSQAYNSVKLNGQSITNQHIINQPGVYQIEAKDANNCRSSQTIVFNNYPNYLSETNIMGDDAYIKNAQSIYYVSPFNLQNYWLSYKWQASNASFSNSVKLNTRVIFTEDTSTLYYTIKDFRQCSYSLSRKLKDKSVSVDAGLNSESFNIYPNPVAIGLVLHFSQAVTERIEVYNAQGQLVLTEFASQEGRDQLQLDVVNTGIYFIKIGELGVFKILVN